MIWLGPVGDLDDYQIVTYNDVAKWLPSDILHAITVTLPCAGWPTGRHSWQHNRQKMNVWERVEPVLVSEHWRCRGCDTVVNRDPHGTQTDRD